MAHPVRAFLWNRGILMASCHEMVDLPLAVRITVRDSVLDVLVDRIARQSSGAFIALQRLFGAHLLDEIRQHLDDPAACDSVLQATMLEVWEQARLRPPHSAGAREWICGIARRQAASARSTTRD